jgi:flavin-dependent dehydrogenase
MVDVVILGAGPAGTPAAFDLLSSGFSVLLLDNYAPSVFIPFPLFH